MAYDYEWPYVNSDKYNADWLLNEMKKVMTEWAKMQIDFTNLQNNFDNLEEYVKNYFANLDLTAEVTAILQDMKNSGELEAIINSAVIKTNFWGGKKVVVYGDSLSLVNGSYWDTVALNTGAEITNRAISGTTLSGGHGANGGVEIINAASDLDDFNVVVLAYGTNDWQGSVDLYSTAFSSVLGAMIFIIENITQKAPKADIVFVALPFAYRGDFSYGTLNSLGKSAYDYAEFIQRTAVLYGAKCINLSKIANIRNDNKTTMLEKEATADVYVHFSAYAVPVIGTLVSYADLSTDISTYGGNVVLGFTGWADAIEKTGQSVVALQDMRDCIPQLLLNANSSYTSMPFQLCPNALYRITGYSQGQLSLNLESKTYIVQGDFDICHRALTSNGVITITNNTNNNYYVSNLQVINQDFPQGPSYLMSPPEIGVDIIDGNKIILNYNGLLILSGMTIKATLDIAAGNTIMEFSGYNSPKPKYIIGVSGTTPYCFILQNGKITNLSPIPNATLIHIPATLIIPNIY